MTVLTGIPTLPGATVRVRVDGPFYQRGDAADPGRYTGIWNGTAYKDDDGDVIDLIMPRKDQGDPMISGDVKIYLSYVFASGRDFTQTLTYRPTYWVETEPGFFDLSKNLDPDAPQIATAEQLQRLSTMLTAGEQQQAQTQQALADIAQTQDQVVAQQQANNAMTAANIGRGSVATVADLAGKPAGLYNIISGADAGQVHEVLADGSHVPRPDLTAAPLAADLARRNTARADLAAKSRVDGPQFADGNRWVWGAGGAANGGAAFGTIVEAADGGAWFREHSGPVAVEWFSGLALPDDWIPAINAAITLASAQLPAATLPVKPTATHYIKVPSNRVLSGHGDISTLRVVNGHGSYGDLISQANSSVVVENILLTRFRIDQNPDQGTGAIAVGQRGIQQGAIGFYAMNAVTVDDVTIDLATGVNTICINSPSGRDAVVQNCRIHWARRAANAEFDNSAIYVEANTHRVMNNIIRARSVADGAWGAIESHGSEGIVTGNVITNFADGINVVPDSTDDLPTNSQIISANTVTGGAFGVRLWPITGKTTRNVQITGNSIRLMQGQWPDHLTMAGVMVNWAADGSQSGLVDGLRISGNDVVFDDTEPRANLEYSGVTGIGLIGENNVNNATIENNTVTNAPLSAYSIGRAGRTIRNLRMNNNASINAGRAVNQAPADLRVPLALAGTIINGVIRNFDATEDSATLLAVGLLFNSMTNDSSVLFDGTRIYAPNNPALKWPDYIPPTVQIQTRTRQIVRGIAPVTIVAQSVYESEVVNLPWVTATATVAVRPPTNFPAGLMATGLVIGPGQVRVRIMNGTAAPIAMPYGEWGLGITQA